MTYKKILKALAKQEEIEGKSHAVDVLRMVLPHVKTSSQWSALTKVKFHRYGKNSYQCHRFYYPNETLIGILSIFTEKT